MMGTHGISNQEKYSQQKLSIWNGFNIGCDRFRNESGSVITNWETNEKYGWGSPLYYPQFSILDPVNTFTVPKNQTIYGMVDMMSHVFEQYFNP